MQRLGLLALAGLSGACGLTFELIWVRQASLLLGHTAVAMSAVVAAFLGGLGLGAFALARRIDAVRRPLAIYGALECVTAVSAAALTVGLPRAAGWAAGIGPWPARAVIAAALVVVPAAAMGGTLPALVRAAVEMGGGGTGQKFGAIYAVNTLGAAVGCLLAGFVALGAFGITNTGLLAAVGNLVAGGIAIAWSRRTVLREIAAPSAQFVRTPARDALDRRLLALAAASGFAALSLEILWFRALASALDSTSYALSLLLTVYLTGLVAGAWLFARRPLPTSPLRRFGEVALLFAFAALGSLALLGQLRGLEHLVPLGRAPFLAMALRAATVLLIPCALSGYALPLLVEASSHASGVATRSGRIYGANTAGGIAGTLLTGLWLIPRFGTQPAFAVACAVSAAAALRATWPGEARSTRAILAGTAALALCLALLPRGYLVRGLTHFSDSTTLDVREGVDGTLAVLEYDRASTCGSGLYACEPGCPDFHHRQLLFGATSYASTVLPARRYMRALGHLPMLLHPSPADALVICFGTGITAAAVASDDRLQSLTLVDLNADVFDVAGDFREVNGGVLSDPRVRVSVDDARHFLASTDQAFDVIAFEPPPPRSAGAVDLYTADFYAQVKRRLRPGGVVAQWIPLGQQSDALSRSLVGALTTSFAHATLWLPARLDAIVIASDAPLEPEAIASRWPSRTQVSLDEVGLGRPEAMLGTFVAGTAALQRYASGAPALTDDRPLVELFLSADPAPFDGEALAALTPDTSLKRLIRAHLLARQGNDAAAREQVEPLGPDPYTDFLRSMEYGCLRPAR
ncbi:MAG TPA: fused MFS/spermidine synthase [Myxococcaceae bacterium]